MANESRHAAWQTERRFAVRLLPEEGDPTELADGLGDFLEAVDFAVDWLTREDPERTGTASLAIFETSSGEAEKVWAYPPDGPPDDAPLMKIFGFDPVTWRSPSAEYSPREPALGTFFTRAPENAAPPPPRAAPVAPRPAPVLPPPRPAVVAAVEHEEPPQPDRPRLRPRRALAAAWADPVARSFLVAAGVALWLAVAFSSAAVLALVLLAVSGLWWRRDKLIATADPDSEDWL
ncbi:MAG TPA: hypothetical protein VMT59_05070 [Gaiellaceae bacterium]|nr:hypothetical protein [Gaiellaceae bacterium]